MTNDNLADSKKNKILLFGTNVVGKIDSLKIDYCDIEICHYPNSGEYEKLKRLSEYNLVILDYKAFSGQGVERQDIFDKQLTHALTQGSSVCFLHYNETVPDFNDNYSLKNHMDSQIGLAWALAIAVPENEEYISHSIQVKRQEFKSFSERWGTSKTVFVADDEKSFDEIFILGDKLSGFAFSSYSGKVIFLPCQRDLSRLEDLKECLTTLINSILNYLKKTEVALPSWAETPLFSGETEIYEELKEHKLKVSKLEDSLEIYQEAKSLPFLREYNFETAVPRFFKDNLGLSILRNDICKEDFWITDSKGEKQVICETKSYLRGLKKSGIYSIFTHRETNDLDEDFPSLLIVNPHTIANSWKEKIQPIPPQDYKLAVKNNVLIMRIEDLLFFWNLMIEGKKTKDELLSLILAENGWLEVNKEGKIIPHK